MGKKWLGWLTAIAAFGAGVQANATNLIINGDFELTTQPGSSEFGGSYPSNQVTGWTTDGYNFVFASGTADTTGAVGEYDTLTLWGPHNGAANGLTASSPFGGNFIAADGGFTGHTLPISQDVTGLMIGQTYTVSFWWAAAQQFGYDGGTTENWTVSFGDQSFTTPTVSNAEHGFVPWTKATYDFTATSSTQTLSFLANGTPEGQPPFSLLDHVSLTVPEPATWAMMIIGFGLVGAAMRGRRNVAGTRSTFGPRVGIA